MVTDDDFDDSGRYGIPALSGRTAGHSDSSAGWEPPNKHRKALDEYRKKHPFINPNITMLEMRPASAWITPKAQMRNRELFGSLWREGEVAVLFGCSGAGKSILAVQIAEAIAQGRSATGTESAFFPFRNPHSAIRNRKVLYLDFELNEHQFTERYSAPSPIPGKLPVRCRFKFNRTEIEWDGTIPSGFNDVLEFMQHSIMQKTEESGARVVIIDNISYLAKNIMSNTACISVLKNLKRWAGANGLSILVIAHARSRRRPAAITLGDIAGSSYIGNLADSVFAIGRSTFGPEYRYVKHLKTRSAQVVCNASNILTYRLGRVSSPHTSKGASIALIPHSAIRTPHSEGPFLAFEYLGPSSESDHLRDYAAEALLAEQREKQQLRKSKSVVNMLMSREYKRYIEG